MSELKDVMEDRTSARAEGLATRIYGLNFRFLSPASQMAVWSQAEEEVKAEIERENSHEPGWNTVTRGKGKEVRSHA